MPVDIVGASPGERPLVVAVGDVEVSHELEWLPGRVVQRRHVVEKGRCPCKQHYASGPTPERVLPGGLYGPGFIAKLIVDRCGDATPLFRVERELERLGVPVARSTLGDLVHAGADALQPLYDIVPASMDGFSCGRPLRARHRAYPTLVDLRPASMG